MLYTLDFTGARDSEWQWHQLGHMQVCTSLQTDNHVGTPLLSFLQAGCPSCHPTNSVKALKANIANNKGPKIDPCSTPLTTATKLKHMPLKIPLFSIVLDTRSYSQFPVQFNILANI